MQVIEPMIQYSNYADMVNNTLNSTMLEQLEQIPCFIAPAVHPMHLTGGGVPGLVSQLDEINLFHVSLTRKSTKMDEMLTRVRQQIDYLKEQISSVHEHANFIQPVFNIEAPSNDTYFIPSKSRPYAGVDSIALEFRTQSRGGIMITFKDSTQHRHSGRTMRLVLSRGRPFLSYTNTINNNRTVQRATTNRAINDGYWHKLRITRVGSMFTLWELPSYLNDTRYNATTTITVPSTSHPQSLPQFLIFGGHLKKGKKRGGVSLAGCMKNVYINGLLTRSSQKYNCSCMSFEERLQEMMNMQRQGYTQGGFGSCVVDFHQREYLSTLNTKQNQLTITFKTSDSHGLLALFQAYAQMVWQLAIYNDNILLEGQVNDANGQKHVFRHFCKHQIAGDDAWHSVAIITTNTTSSIYFDGHECNHMDYSLINLNMQLPALSVYVKSTYVQQSVVQRLPSRSLMPMFTGYLRHITLNNRILSFQKQHCI